MLPDNSSMTAMQTMLGHICMIEFAMMYAINVAHIIAIKYEHVENAYLMALGQTIAGMPLLATAAFGPWDTPGGYLFQSLWGLVLVLVSVLSFRHTLCAGFIEEN